jgi:quercetin dioxygenase-like cupin family protein
MPYTYRAPAAASFTGKGLSGFTFGPLKHKNVEIYYIESEKGHDTFIVSKKISRIYYVLSGSGYFNIDNKQYPVEAGVVVEIPSQLEYSYTGRMTLLCISAPRWFLGNDRFTRWNPDVIGFDAPCAVDNQTWRAALARVSIFGKSPLSIFLKFNRRLWTKIPANILSRTPIHLYGRVLHKLV